MEQREIAKLKPHPSNPRGSIRHDESLRELAMSIREQGVLQPIIITPSGRIIAGHRRVEAAKLAELKVIPVIVKNLSESEQLQLLLIENLQREDLNVVQEGACYTLLVAHSLTPNQIGKAIGLPVQRIRDCIAVQALPEDTQQLFAANKIALSCAAVLVELPRQDQFHWANLAAQQKYSGTGLRKAIDREAKPHKPRPVESDFIARTVNTLKAMDLELDAYELRTVQSLLRQAVQLLQKHRSAKAA